MTINSSNISLELARRLTDVVNAAWESGEMLQKVTPTTATLLKYWFGEAFCATRTRNFHEGQRQAILNIVYLHEVLGERRVTDAYEGIIPELTDRADLAQLAKPKYQMPKYAVKMATGTGKTWVMHALIIWQMLNARHEPAVSGRFTQRFLVVAPGLIVYDRLLDAFCGRKKRGEDSRDPQTNDYCINQDVFIPERYRDEVFSFVQNNVVTKEQGIGRKTTGDGLIAITNWHLFENQMAGDGGNDAPSSTATPAEIIGDLLPVRPGKAAGNDLSALDRRALGSSELEYLAALSDLMVINDEAHHIHEIKRGGETEEVEWQRGLNAIGATKGTRFIQVDFSATPFDTRGTGDNLVKLFFPHIVVDFDLPMAMKRGLVKLLLLDRRQELTDLEDLDYNAERDEQGKVTGLSEGQRMMLRAGLTKLQRLEEEFLKQDASKNPKMLVVCQDTAVSPFVEEFLKTEGLGDNDVVTIDSNKQGEVKDEEWKEIKTRLFDIDRHKSPKVVVSVLMLREGFDVNNICVLVPLRSSQAPILLAVEGIVTKHIVEQFAVAIYKMQSRLTTIDAEVTHTCFSSLQAIKMRESYSLEVGKCIYPRLGYPSHGGGLERAFIEFLDRDAEVERFLKINETGHSFAIIFYVRKDGLMATYHPDFIVATHDRIYLIETKGDDKVDDQNVRQKQTATVEWIKKINALHPEYRMNRIWEYALVGESVFMR